MATGPRQDILQGTLTLLILQTLEAGEKHGYAIAHTIEQVSQELLRVEEGSLYPALHRMEQDGVIKSQWKLTETNRRARFYSLTAAGRTRLKQETESWERLKAGVGLVLGWAQ
jgi:transcriptional regulator